MAAPGIFPLEGVHLYYTSPASCQTLPLETIACARSIHRAAVSERPAKLMFCKHCLNPNMEAQSDIRFYLLAFLLSATLILCSVFALLLSPPCTLWPLRSSHMPSVTLIVAALPLLPANGIT